MDGELQAVKNMKENMKQSYCVCHEHNQPSSRMLSFTFVIRHQIHQTEIIFDEERDDIIHKLYPIDWNEQNKMRQEKVKL